MEKIALLEKEVEVRRVNMENSDVQTQPACSEYWKSEVYLTITGWYKYVSSFGS